MSSFISWKLGKKVSKSPAVLVINGWHLTSILPVADHSTRLAVPLPTLEPKQSAVQHDTVG